MTSNANERPDNVRASILREATRLFAERGFNGTTLQAIADAVGVRKPSLIYHFASKEVLREEVIEKLLEHWKDEIPRLLQAATGGQDRFVSLVMALVGFFQADSNRAQLVVREILDRPERVRTLVHEHITPWTKLITDYIRADQARGRIWQDVDPEAYLAEVILMVLGTLATQHVAGEIVGEAEGFSNRLVTELVRISREALFVHRFPLTAEQ